MAVARETVRLGLSAREQSKIKVRQPLRAAVIVAEGAERAAIERLADVVADELNVKELRFVDTADELGSYEVKANYRTLGPRFGKAMPLAAAAIAALDPAHVAAALRDGRHDRPVGRRPRARARPRRPAAGDAAAGGLPARARGLARRRAGARARPGAAHGGPGARGRARGAGDAQARRPGGRGPHRADARRRRRAARRRARVRGATSAARRWPPTVVYDGADVAGEPAKIEGRELRIAVAKA